ncbi:SDR family NAD(P)-dependent oxidoreductase [Bradyrhizobium sp. KB893862 SZCCT0404]|uniref:SDR family NAD(P)-dependent oxidoreductase n=1 Tax=Bradyrhizobium sp. KB893862 SZCCT0404 TaxID=2807672 RepID=UPI001BA64F91|nr:SDR family NAD(P)-dependent oxidoreductase [Bradyrhizobium sp. KB893862 SZCCT0404]MBR1177213.1 SDR family NAD(P)-dependent oxidoreductase [Bradyrhizobium sp. KB893862 SZCCT0404]
MRAVFHAHGDVFVITGGANGIGRALVKAAAAAGARVVVCDVDISAMQTLAAEDSRIVGRRLDVGDRGEVFATFAGIEREFGRIDGLVCGAAIQPRTAVQAMDPTEWQRVLDINLNGVVWCYQAVIGGMVARRHGSIVAFSSGLAHQGWPQASAYAATKAALIAFAKSAAKEVAAHRVRFNLIAPGVIDTPQYRAANAGTDDANWRASTGVGEPEDVVGPLLFLLSDAATMTASLVSRDFAYPAQT